MGRGSVEILMLRLGSEGLRRVIERALAGKDGAKFVYQPELFEKLKVDARGLPSLWKESKAFNHQALSL